MSHALTVVITRDVDNRYRGLLRSVMPEASTGIYVSSQLNREARERLWEVISRWNQVLQRGCIIMIWKDRDAFGGIGIKKVGDTPKELHEVDGILLTRIDK